VVSQLTLYLEREAGFTQLEAIQVFSLAFALSFFGKFLFGAASDWFAKRHVMLAASLTLLAGTLLLFDNGAASGGLRLTDDAAQLRAFAVVFGLGFGGSFTMIQLTVVESFGQRDLGKILGMVIFVDGIAGAAGPLVAGELATRTGSYLPAFMVVAAVTALAVVNVLFIRPVPPD
jgi:MFS family permease